jgi:hypothetical protein
MKTSQKDRGGLECQKVCGAHSAREGVNYRATPHDRVIGYQTFGALARVVLVTAEKKAIGVNADIPTRSHLSQAVWATRTSLCSDVGWTPFSPSPQSLRRPADSP